MVDVQTALDYFAAAIAAGIGVAVLAYVTKVGR